MNRILRAELAPRVEDVLFHRSGANGETKCQPLRALSLGEHLEALDLSRRQARESSRRLAEMGRGEVR